MNTTEIAEVASAVLRPSLGPAGLDHIEVEEGHDHDGDPAVFVTAYYRQGSAVPPGTLQSDAHGALHEALQHRGESRFPYLRHRFENQEGFEDEDLEEEKGGAAG